MFIYSLPVILRTLVSPWAFLLMPKKLRNWDYTSVLLVGLNKNVVRFGYVRKGRKTIFVGWRRTFTISKLWVGNFCYALLANLIGRQRPRGIHPYNRLQQVNDNRDYGNR